MKNLINQQSTRTKQRKLLLAVLAVLPLATGCDGLVDKPAETGAVMDVAPYYAKLRDPGMTYHYTTSFAPKSGIAPKPDTLQMEMYGRASYDHLSMPTYGCDWTFLGSGYAPKWYYCLTADSAVDLGDDTFNEHWTDLKAPLAKGNSWTFTRMTGEVVTAKIIEMGSSVRINGREFSNVIAVQYSGDKGTTSVRWFAKDIGMIFGHTEDAGGSQSEERFVDLHLE